jgi:hypothetical protein
MGCPYARGVCCQVDGGLITPCPLIFEETAYSGAGGTDSVLGAGNSDCA